jgi:hypothetical protein
MSRRSIVRFVVAPLVLAGLFLGCGSRPVPLTVQAGSTFTLLVPNSLDGSNVGFGRAAQGAFGPASLDPGDFQTGLPSASEVPFDPASPLEDVQRGELAIKLFNSSAAFWLPVRYLSRVDAAAESDAGLDGRVLESGRTVGGHPANQQQVGQIVAFVDVPAEVPQGTYRFRPVLIRRDPVTADFVHVSHGELWGDAGSDELFVLSSDLGPGVPAPTPLRAIWRELELSESETGPLLESIVPNPSLVLLMVDAPPPDTTTSIHPAAASLEILYPGKRVEVLGVVHHEHVGTGSSIRWRTEAVAGEPDDCSTRRRLRADLVDADQRTDALGVVFMLKDPFGACPGAVSPSDFEMEDAQLYDIDGSALDLPNFAVMSLGIF